MYNYEEQIKADVRDYIEENYTRAYLENLDDLYDLYEELNDELFVNDSVTGNASGSYFCNTYKAKECVTDNIELLGEALREFGCGWDYLEKGWEACDVTIRCYLLGQCISEVLDELKDEYSE